MLRALWLVFAHDLSEDRYMNDVTGNLSLFKMARGFKKSLWDYFELKQVKALKKSSQDLSTEKKNGETET